MSIEAQQVVMTQEAAITSSAFTGDGGTVSIDTHDLKLESGSQHQYVYTGG